MTSLNGPVRAATLNRRRALMEILSASDPVGVETLAGILGVSESTVRRDLVELERAGHVLRVFGGVLSRRSDPSWREKERRNADSKRRIAQSAAQLVHPGNLVFLDAGTTVAVVAGHLAPRQDLTLATVGLPSLVSAADGSATVLVVGGRLHQRGGRLAGAWTEQILDLLSPDIAFLGADFVDPARGINCPDPELAALKSHIIEISDASWILLDRSKISDRHRHHYWARIPRSVGFVIEKPSSGNQQAFVDELRTLGHPVRIV